MRISTIVNAHLTRERLDVLLSVILPLVLMVESGYANGWVYAGGVLDVSLNTAIALVRGLFLEALIFAMFKIVRILCLKGQWKYYAVAFLPLSIGMVTMVVSAGLNIAWANRSGEMQSVMLMVGQFLPSGMFDTFKVGVGLIFPIAVGVFALLDVGHLIREAIDATPEMNKQALLVGAAEAHREGLEKEMRRAAKQAQTQYKDIADAHMTRMVQAVKAGNYSFGLDELKAPTASSATRVTSVQSTVPLAPAPSYPQIAAPPPIPGQWQTMPLPPNPYQR